MPQDNRVYESGRNVYQANSSSRPSGGSTSAHGTGQNVDLPKPAPAPSGPSLGEVAAAAKAKKAPSAPAKKVYTTDDLKSYKHGTDYVPKTGPANLHEGEAVLTKEEAEEYRAAKGKPEKMSEADESYRAVYLRRKLNAPKDGTPISGFVTAKENKPPRECGNCKWFKVSKGEDGHCGHPLVMIDPKVAGENGKPKPVDADDCCDNFQSLGNTK